MAGRGLYIEIDARQRVMAANQLVRAKVTVDTSARVAYDGMARFHWVIHWVILANIMYTVLPMGGVAVPGRNRLRFLVD